MNMAIIVILFALGRIATALEDIAKSLRERVR